MNFGPGSEKDGQVFYFMIYDNVLQRRKIFILYGRHQYRHWNDWIRKKSAPGAEEKLGKNQANVVGREDSKLQYRPSWGHYATVQRREALCASSAAVG